MSKEKPEVINLTIHSRGVSLPVVLTNAGMAHSASMAKRLIAQGAVTLNEQVVEDAGTWLVAGRYDVRVGDGETKQICLWA